ncbi:group-specific protein [Bacillus sp. CH30_1T]|uniref:nucleoside 2-deoxyribosyltransferase n=1 Tax=Bacillus sp. CH30_1T TaxID=2604836 RepID=UPI0011EBD188|nr:nucleoside 2-deoxyribosyltransferase [Bacillus sp. CH30_1T]KAA0561789.1 group-specific protein [Bacillus sp. CH30_1T]
MNFYVASSFHNIKQVRDVSERLKRKGYIHTYDWTQNSRASTVEELKKIGEKEKQAIIDSDVILVLLPGGKGSHVELGIALGLNKRVILYSPHNELSDFALTTTFYHLPEVEVCAGTVEELVDYVTAGNVLRKAYS